MRRARAWGAISFFFFAALLGIGLVPATTLQVSLVDPESPRYQHRCGEFPFFSFAWNRIENSFPKFIALTKVDMKAVLLYCSVFFFLLFYLFVSVSLSSSPAWKKKKKKRKLTDVVFILMFVCSPPAIPKRTARHPGALLLLFFFFVDSILVSY